MQLCVLGGCLQQNYEENKCEFRKQRRNGEKLYTQNIFESAEYFLHCTVLDQVLPPPLILPPPWVNPECPNGCYATGLWWYECLKILFKYFLSQ